MAGSDAGGIVIDKTVNLHDASTDIADVYIENGVEKGYQGWSITDYIPVDPGAVYALVGNVCNNDRYSSVYNQDKSALNNGRFIACMCHISDFVLGSLILIPDDAAYVRFSGISENLSAFCMYRVTGAITIIE